MDIKFFASFSKRENSTKQPDLANPTRTLTGYLIEECSIYEPTFKIERFASDASPQSYTYAYIQEFARYYFVQDWEWANGLWLCKLKVDVLASFKAVIGSTSAYIERTSAPSYWDGRIIDKLYPAKQNFQYDVVSFDTVWNKYSATVLTNHFFIIGVLGKASTTASAVTYYKLTMSQMQSLMNYLMSDAVYEDMGFGGLAEPLTVTSAKAMYNPIQYITSCFLFHLDFDDFNNIGTLGDIQIGPYQVWQGSGDPVGGGYIRKFQGYVLGSQAQMSNTKQIQLPPNHPQAGLRGGFLLYKPYTRLTMFIPPFGVIPIDPSNFEVGDVIQLETYIDGATGKARLIINSYTATPAGQAPIVRPISEHDSLFGIPVQLAQISIDYFHASIATIEEAMGISTMLAGAGTGSASAMASGASMTLKSIGNSVEAQTPQLLTQGINGSSIAFRGSSKLVATHTLLVDDDMDDMGKPACTVAQISTVGTNGTGNNYIKCGEVHIAFPCFIPEREEITSFLLGGFFYE